MNHRWQHPKEELVATMQRIYRYRMTTTSGGNLSILDPDGSIWITPSRVDKGSLQPADIVRVHPDNTKEGRHPPSSEFPFHREIYRRRPDIKAIVHAHPGALVAFSICKTVPQTRIQSHVHSICGRVALAPYACPGTQALGDRIAEAFATGADAVILENHGVVVGGSDLQAAFQRFETLEFAALTQIRAGALGPVRLLSEAEASVETLPHFDEGVPHTPSNREKELRAEICRFTHRAYQQRLLISTAGSLSTRLEGNEFVITPRRRDRLDLQPAGLVRVANRRRSPGQSPSRAALLHAKIYEKFPEVGAIINAQPAHASAFCMSAEPFSTYTIPESYVVLNEVKAVPHLRIVEDADVIVASLDDKKNPCLLIANEGVLVLGRTLLEAFDRLEVLEATAEALLMARSIGPLAPMSMAAIDELREVFRLP